MSLKETTPIRLFSKAPDGGKSSGVTGYYLIEVKWLFTIVLLHFAEGTREAYHSHAFNAVTVWLKGIVGEEYPDGSPSKLFMAGDWKYTPRTTFHRIRAWYGTWALSFRGPWQRYWWESRPGAEGQVLTRLAHGRVEVPPCG